VQTIGVVQTIAPIPTTTTTTTTVAPRPTPSTTRTSTTIHNPDPTATFTISATSTSITIPTILPPDFNGDGLLGLPGIDNNGVGTPNNLGGEDGVDSLVSSEFSESLKVYGF
jgi:hypothetical protein